MFKELNEYTPIETDWSYNACVNKCETYLTPAIDSFRAYKKPIVLERGQGHYLWDADG